MKGHSISLSLDGPLMEFGILPIFAIHHAKKSVSPGVRCF
jgi:hypothetical protein